MVMVGSVGCYVGSFVGAAVGLDVGTVVGSFVGRVVGSAVETAAGSVGMVDMVGIGVVVEYSVLCYVVDMEVLIVAVVDCDLTVH